MSNRRITDTTGYLDSLIQLIPAEFIATYIAIKNVVLSSIEEEGLQSQILIISSIILLIILPVYLYKLQQITSKSQIFCSVISFAVWVISLGLILDSYTWYLPVYSTIAIIIWTLAAPIFVKEN